MSGREPSSALDGARVVFVLQTFALGGSERQAVLLAEHLRRAHGCEVTALAAEPAGSAGDQMRAAGVTTETIALRGPHRNLSTWWRLRRTAARLAAHRPDLLLPVTSTPNVVCGLVWRRTGARACAWRQGDPGLALSGKPLARRAAQACSLALANSDDGAAFLRDVLAVPAGRVHRIHNAILLPATRGDPGPWRDRLGAAAGAPVVAMVAHFESRKDHATMLRAWRHVVDRRGEGPVLALAGRDGATAAEADALIASLDLALHVRRLGAIDDVDGLLAASDLVALASHAEGTPNATLEAMARGLAVVATDLPGTREALGAEASDDLVPEGDDEALAARLLHYLDAPERRAARGERNRRRIEERYEHTRACTATSALLAAALAQAPRPPVR